MTNIANPRAETLYGFPQPNQRQSPLPIIANRAPLSTDVGYPIGQPWIYKNNGGYELIGVVQGVANWQPTSGTGAVDSVSGTANQITAVNSGGAVTLSLPAAIVAPGSIVATTTVASTTTMTAGTGLTVTTGNATISSGNANVTGNVVASKSAAGAAVSVQATNSDNTSGTSNAGVEVATGGSSSGDPYLSFQISGVGASTMTMGLDNSASDLFVISNSSSIGTSNALTLSQAGALNATTSITAGTSLTATLGNITATNGDVVISAAGKTLNIKSGTNAKCGVATLVAGSATVSNVPLTANSSVLLTNDGPSGTTGALSATLNVGGSSFVINSTSGTDVSTVSYLVFERS